MTTEQAAKPANTMDASIIERRDEFINYIKRRLLAMDIYKDADEVLLDISSLQEDVERAYHDVEQMIEIRDGVSDNWLAPQQLNNAVANGQSARVRALLKVPALLDKYPWMQAIVEADASGGEIVGLPSQYHGIAKTIMGVLRPDKEVGE